MLVESTDVRPGDMEGLLYYAMLYKGLEHPWILVYMGAPETNPPWILKSNCMIRFSEVKDKENFESSKRKVTGHIHRSPHKTISRFLSRNLTGQEVVG